VIAVLWAVTDLVKELGHDMRLRRCRVERERDLVVAELPSDSCRDDDQRVARIKTGDLHGKSSGVIGARIRPV
jgi:hypothetical protein